MSATKTRRPRPRYQPGLVRAPHHYRKLPDRAYEVAVHYDGPGSSYAGKEVRLTVLNNRRWWGGQNASMDVTGEYQPTGTWTWHHPLGWGFRLELRAHARSFRSKGKRTYAWSVRLELGSYKLSRLVAKGEASTLKEVRAAGEHVRQHHLSLAVVLLLQQAYRRERATCVWRWDREAGDWIPFCSDFDIDWHGDFLKRAGPGRYHLVSARDGRTELEGSAGSYSGSGGGLRPAPQLVPWTQDG